MYVIIVFCKSTIKSIKIYIKYLNEESNEMPVFKECMYYFISYLEEILFD